MCCIAVATGRWNWWKSLRKEQLGAHEKEASKYWKILWIEERPLGKNSKGLFCAKFNVCFYLSPILRKLFWSYAHFSR